MPRFVYDVMHRNPVLVGTDREARAAGEDARALGVRHVVVTDGVSALAVVSADVLAVAPIGVHVSAFAVPDVTPADEQATLREALTLMDAQGVDCIPVTTWEGLFVGVVARDDVRMADSAQAALALDDVARCVACGSAQNLDVQADLGIAFCEECLVRARATTTLGGEDYITLGGGD